MPEATLSVSELLGLSAQGSAGEICAGISGDEWTALQAQLARALPGMPWASVQEIVCRRLSEVLDVDLMTLFAGAWEKYQLLADAAEQSKSGETVLVPLAEHAITSKLHPCIEILWGPQVLKKIEFEVTLSLTLKGVILKVEAAEIRAIEAGSCEGSGEIGVFQKSIWKRDLEPIPLPGKVQFKTGIPIRS